MTIVEFYQKLCSFLMKGTDTLYFKKQELTKKEARATFLFILNVTDSLVRMILWNVFLL